MSSQQTLAEYMVELNEALKYGGKDEAHRIAEHLTTTMTRLFDAARFVARCGVEMAEWASENQNEREDLLELATEQRDRIVGVLGQLIEIGSDPTVPPSVRSMAAAMLEVARDEPPKHITVNITADIVPMEEVNAVRDTIASMTDDPKEECACGACAIERVFNDNLPAKPTLLLKAVAKIAADRLQVYAAEQKAAYEAADRGDEGEDEDEPSPEDVKDMIRELEEDFRADHPGLDDEDVDVVAMQRIDIKTGKSILYDPKTGEPVEADIKDMVEAHARRKEGRLS